MKDCDYITLAKDIRDIFERDHKILNDLSFPFFYDFPKNSCQSASVFFSVCLQQLFPKAEILVIHGINNTNEHHYWVEVDKKNYDLTLDQFEPMLSSSFQHLSYPIYSESIHPLADHFTFKYRDNPTDAFVRFITKHANLNEVMNGFNYCYIKLRKKGWFSDFNTLTR